MKLKLLKELVIKEAKALKKLATPQELSNLKIENLSTLDRNRCIYGQITGDCFNSRAEELIMDACERVYTPGGVNGPDGAKINGKPEYDRFNSEEQGAGKRVKYYSPIEVFIDQRSSQTSGNNERLVKFLKGETKTLKFI